MEPDYTGHQKEVVMQVSPKRKKKRNEESKVVVEKRKISTKNRTRTEMNNVNLLQKAHRQIDELQSIVEELR